MFRRDATVDNADNYVLTVESRGPAKPHVSVKKSKKIKTIIRCQRPNLVFPDMQNLVHAGELVGLGRMHPRGESIEPEAVAIDQFGTATCFREYAILFPNQFLGVALDRRVRLVEPSTRHTG